ncbi:MAG: YgiT-type zinc finger protein [Anaerolineaceae bacterium]|jgi:YgiT-type zinc finger domain-containing protein|nr:YgiT-type zinc finger protein [Anaerolineaceae bacterium]
MSDETFSQIDPVFPCRECQAGHMHRDYVAYFTWLGDELISVPDFPAWVCDICGRCEYDENALTRLTLLLSPNAGKTLSPTRIHSRKSAVKQKVQRPTQSES